MDTSDVRKGLKMTLDGNPYVVVDFQFVKPGFPAQWDPKLGIHVT